jgi:threonine dehydrogenase-like Zn-dependent dehydrogenase
VVKPSRRLLPIPEGVSYAHATMAIDGIGASFGGLRAIGVDALDTVLVTGLGPVGLGGVVNARFQHARVFGVEPVAWRRERALEMGAERVFDPRDENVLEEIMALTNGRGVDRALDCSGTVEGERLCIDAARRRGRVAFVGECRQDLCLRIGPDMLTKGLLLAGAWCFNTGDYPRIMQIIRESPLMDLLVSHVMPMSRIQDALELLVTGQCAKVVLKPWE